MEINPEGYPVAWAEDGIIVINFGVRSGREATQAELDRLARALRKAGAGTEMTIAAVRRQDYGQGFEGVVHQVHVTLDDSSASWLEICREWASNCAEEWSSEPLEIA